MQSPNPNRTGSQIDQRIIFNVNARFSQQKEQKEFLDLILSNSMMRVLSIMMIINYKNSPLEN